MKYNITGSERGLILLEAFCNPPAPGEPLPKRSRVEEDLTVPFITAGQNVPSTLVHSFIVAVRCWDLLHVNEILERGL